MVYSSRSRKPKAIGTTRRSMKSKKQKLLRPPVLPKRVALSNVVVANRPRYDFHIDPHMLPDGRTEAAKPKNKRTNYKKLRENEVDNWNKIIQAMVAVDIEREGEPFDECDLCHEKCDGVIINCPDCGLDSSQCEACCIKVHSGKLLHKPRLWQVHKLILFGQNSIWYQGLDSFFLTKHAMIALFFNNIVIAINLAGMLPGTSY